MKQDFTIEVAADNNFSILNRIINVLNRRRVRIKRLVAHEDENDFRRGGATMLLHTTPDMIEKVKHQLEKLIEVESAVYYEGSSVYTEISLKNSTQVA
jgi:acetolactate synthase-1/3 small subunit